MSIYSDILKKYWGYDGFRPLQEDIIRSVADRNEDTLGLLPTGGGKSIIFQVPALSKEGTCIVITPLIALMKDQVENLRRRNIKAAAVYSGMTSVEIQSSFDSCIFGDTKFLYMSPERLSTEMFVEKLKQMNVSILAIDEAHCISQWGYDFRPSYLKIANVRALLPNVPVLALTATATPEVADDIMDKLQFKTKNLFRKSFARKNLIYLVRKVADKNNYLLRIFNAQPGTGIVYVRNRKRTKEASEFLQKSGISADYFHAGLTPEYKDYRQAQWKNGKIRIICSTNAFGMGIDKPDVRTVVHIDLPDSIEGYFQEAGRGGRDEKKAYAVLLYDEHDITNLRRNLTNSFPEKSFIKTVYKAFFSSLPNGEIIDYGTGHNREIPFNLYEFSQRWNFNQVQVLSALKILQRNGYLEATEEVFTPSKVMFTIGREDLYKFQVAKAQFDGFIKLLLRQYEGIFGNYVAVDETKLASIGRCSVDTIKSYFKGLRQQNVIEYIPQKRTPYIILTCDHVDDRDLIIRPETYELLKQKYEARINAMIKYCLNDQICRSRQLTAYFGETDGEDCGECDVCRSKKRDVMSADKFDEAFDKIFETLSAAPLNIDDLVDRLGLFDADLIKVIVQKMVADEIVEVDDNGVISIIE
ncbi:MAG: RecQ family ATP-dependent DNA helicase [Bacteroidales bacterium]|nr:RecQ family ATP-dependent DNA helicase [Bacteroidales bacterium]